MEPDESDDVPDQAPVIVAEVLGEVGEIVELLLHAAAPRVADSTIASVRRILFLQNEDA
jgi:hypothetical protein